MLWIDLYLIKYSSLLLSANAYFYCVINSFMHSWVIQWLSTRKLHTLYIHISRSRISSDIYNFCYQFMDGINIVTCGLQRYIKNCLLCFIKKETLKKCAVFGYRMEHIYKCITWLWGRKPEKSKNSTRNNMNPSTNLLPKYNHIQWN